LVIEFPQNLTGAIMPTLEERVSRLEQIMQRLGQPAGAVPAAAFGPSIQAGAVPRGMERESYFTQRGLAAAPMGAGPGAAPPVSFTIEIRFLGGLTQNQKNAFRAAADRWTHVITGALPSAMVDGEIIRGVLILAQGAIIDGPGNILGQAGPTDLRPSTAGAAAFIPAKGAMTFDSADLAEMETNGTLRDVITHEMGHVLGVGTIWSEKGVLAGAGSSNPTFTGTIAMREYGALKGTGPTPVPVEETGGQGTADSHWRDSVFRNELMTGFVNLGPNPLSRVTVGSMADLGYQVDLNAAEPFSLPNIAALAEAGNLGLAPGTIDMHSVLPIIPVVLPPEAHLN
jgi:hypothetical protein